MTAQTSTPRRRRQRVPLHERVPQRHVVHRQVIMVAMMLSCVGLALLIALGPRAA